MASTLVPGAFSRNDRLGRSARTCVRYGVAGPSEISATALERVAPSGSDWEVAAVQSPTASFASYRELLGSGRIDAVVLTHRAPQLLRYVVAALEAGVHVLCGEPAAASPADCDALARAARSHTRPLIVASRTALSPVNRAAAEHARLLGDLRVFSEVTCSTETSASVLAAACVSRARQFFREEPSEVLGATRCKLPSVVSATLRFSGERLALFACGFDRRASSRYDVVGSRGHLRACSAPLDRDDDELYVTIDGVTTQHRFSRASAFASELTEFSARVLTQRAPAPTAREALANGRVLAAIEQASSQDSSVRVNRVQRGRARPTGERTGLGAQSAR